MARYLLGSRFLFNNKKRVREYGKEKELREEAEGRR